MRVRRRPKEQPINFHDLTYHDKDGKRLLMSHIRLTKELVTPMCGYLMCNPDITKLFLSSPIFHAKEECAWFLEEGLALIGSIPTITYLDLFGCMLDDAAVTILSQSASASAIKYLILARNDIENPASLRALPQLETLLLDANPITATGASALLTFPALKHLTINGTEIGDEGAKALAASCLSTLTIGDCNMSHEGMMALLANQTLLNLTLPSSDQLGSEYKKPITDMIERNQCAHFFNLFKADQDKGRLLDDCLQEYQCKYDRFCEEFGRERSDNSLEAVKALLNAYQRSYRYFNLLEQPAESSYLANLPTELRRMVNAYTDLPGYRFFSRPQQQMADSQEIEKKIGLNANP